MAIKVVVHKKNLSSNFVIISIIDNNKRIYNRKQAPMFLTESGDIDFEKLKTEVKKLVRYHRSFNKFIDINTGRKISNNTFE